MTTQLPTLGVGLGWREEIASNILDHRRYVDWCELISDHFINASEERLAAVRNISRTLPLIPHGLDLSIGSDAPPDDAYINGLAVLVDAVRAPWFTDHLCFTRGGGLNLGQLGPLQFSEEVLEIVERNVRHLRSFIQIPFLLENISYDFVVPGGSMDEATFINETVRRADIGLLLDVTNVFTNAENHGFDARAFIDRLPLDRVVQLHVAGGHQIDGRWVDSHSFPVPPQVLDLTDYVLQRAPVKAILLERDANFPEAFAELCDELGTLRQLMMRSGVALS